MSFIKHLLFDNTYTPPPVARTHHHRINEGHEPRYVAKPPKLSRKRETAERMYKLIKREPGISVNEMAIIMGNDPSYLYCIKDILLEENRIYGVRGKPIRRGGPMTTLLYVKD